MLTLTLSLTPPDVTVHVNGAESHRFPSSALRRSREDNEAFREAPSTWGQHLYRLLFPPGSPAARALQALPLTTDESGRLALQLEHEALHAEPWEYLHDGQTYLATERPFLRLVQAAFYMPTLTERLRLLFIPSDPLLPFDPDRPSHLDLETEWEELEKALRDLDPPLDLEEVRPPTFAELQNRMAGRRNLILHFTGHGTVQGERAFLIFEQPSGRADEVPDDKVTAAWRGRAILVVLSACRSAAPAQGQEASLAHRLCRQGIPFVLGMRMDVPEISARQFTTLFYRYLMAGEDLFEAVRQARLNLLSRNDPAAERLMGIPVLYAAETGRAILRPAGRGLQVRPSPRPNLSGLPTLESGFFGRQHELVQIGERLTAPPRREGATFQPRTLTLHGIGGIGKTALLRKAAERFAWAFPDGVLAVSLEPLQPTEIVNRLEAFFGLPEGRDAEGRPLELEARLQRLLDALQGKRLLLALDNFESLFKARQEGTEEQKDAATHLYKFFEQIPARGPTLLISSREKTELPGETLIPVRGLSEAAGAELFYSRVSARRAQLTRRDCLEVARAVEGHPLALRLLAPLFDRGEGRDVQDFLKRLDQHLSQARPKMPEGGRHDTLQACFDFSLAYLEKAAPELVAALARLSLFRGDFPAFLAAPVIFGSERLLKEEEDRQTAIQEAEALLLRLWEFGQLEREVLPLGTSALYLYHLHPALRPFATARLDEAGRAAAAEGYFLAMGRLGYVCYPGTESGGIYARADLAQIARHVLPDLIAAASLRDDAEGSALCFHAAFLLTHFGDLDGAMRLYQQSLEIKERLGDLKGKAATLHEMAYIYVTRGDLDGAMRLYQQSLELDERLGDLKGKAATLHEMAYIYVTRGDLDGAMRLYQQSLELDERLGDLKGKAATLHEMAYIYVTRGDLDGAMRLYQQSLEIKERLGDLKGKAATLAMMAQVHIRRGEQEPALRALLVSLQTLSQIGAAPDAQKVAGILAGWRQQMGAEAFDRLWQQVTGQALPQWLK
jgi:tetratricopeptide (TPR) repeat protein